MEARRRRRRTAKGANKMKTQYCNVYAQSNGKTRVGWPADTRTELVWRRFWTLRTFKDLRIAYVLVVKPKEPHDNT